MIVIGIILLVIGVLAKIGIVWTTGFVVLILGLIALLLRVTGHGIGGRQARRRREVPARRRGFPAGRPWRISSPRLRGTPSATARSWCSPPRRGSGRHRSCARRSAPTGPQGVPVRLSRWFYGLRPRVSQLRSWQACTERRFAAQLARRTVSYLMGGWELCVGAAVAWVARDSRRYGACAATAMVVTLLALVSACAGAPDRKSVG